MRCPRRNRSRKPTVVRGLAGLAQRDDRFELLRFGSRPFFQVVVLLKAQPRFKPTGSQARSSVHRASVSSPRGGTPEGADVRVLFCCWYYRRLERWRGPNRHLCEIDGAATRTLARELKQRVLVHKLFLAGIPRNLWPGPRARRDAQVRFGEIPAHGATIDAFRVAAWYGRKIRTGREHDETRDESDKSHRGGRLTRHRPARLAARTLRR